MSLLEQLKIEIGDWLDGVRASRAKDYFVINVAEREDNPEADVCHTLPRKFSTIGPNEINKLDLDFLAMEINRAVQKGWKIFVHCVGGIERSPLVVVWYLHKYHNFSLDDAYEEVRKTRPQILNRRGWIHYDSFEEFLEENKNEKERLS